MRNNRAAFICALFCPGLMFLALQCSNATMTAGTITQSGNGRVAGVLVTVTGTPASGTQVELFPDHYNPMKDSTKIPLDTTDAQGSYMFDGIDTGVYNIVAIQPDRKTRAAKFGINVAGDTVILQPDTLRIPGSIKVALPNAVDTAHGYLYVPGTTIYSRLSDNNGYVKLDSVPAGVTLSIYYAVGNSTNVPRLVRDSATVVPGGMTTLEYVDWKYLRNLYLNTTASGANVPGTVTNFPVLVRLTKNNFDFSQATAGGPDLRFAKSNGTPLPYEIEAWDSAAASAAVWVKVDTVYGNDSTHYITMYWGNPNATSVSNSYAVFDTANGFQGVWHLGEAGDAPALDATVNRYDGSPFGMSVVSAVAGIIGQSRKFDGVTSFIRMSNTASSRLSFKENGVYSISAWAYVDTVDTNFHVIAGKGNLDYYLKLKPPAMGGTIEFVEYESSGGWYYSSGSPFKQSKMWVFISGIRDGATQRLYINGQLIKDGGNLVSKSLPRDEGEDFAIGRYINEAVNPNPPEGFCNFKGAIDEVRASNVANSADWIKLCYMNQKQPDGLVVFK